mmetsp:Transcript_33255/g.67096  ORF Transcript_33255/g.67096 Transcript_33255/m.67096 type:complete len:219 (+) Transcript_33255:2569-3225(+)
MEARAAPVTAIWPKAARRSMFKAVLERCCDERKQDVAQERGKKMNMLVQHSLVIFSVASLGSHSYYYYCCAAPAYMYTSTMHLLSQSDLATCMTESSLFTQQQKRETYTRRLGGESSGRSGGKSAKGKGKLHLDGIVRDGRGIYRLPEVGLNRGSWSVEGSGWWVVTGLHSILVAVADPRSSPVTPFVCVWSLSRNDRRPDGITIIEKISIYCLQSNG